MLNEASKRKANPSTVTGLCSIILALIVCSQANSINENLEIIKSQNEEIVSNIVKEKVNNNIEHENMQSVKTAYVAEPAILIEPVQYMDVNPEEEYEIPNLDTSFKAYMDYRCITDETSKQWEIQQKAWTDSDGFRRVGEDYLVAMGTYYTDECGTRFRIIFENDNEITVTVGDIKDNTDTDYRNQYTAVYDSNGNFYSANVLEFIVDENKIERMSHILGTMGHHDYLEGNIKFIERIETKE